MASPFLVRVLFLAALLWLTNSTVVAQIKWRVSVKIILDSNNQRPFSDITKSNYQSPVNQGSPSEIRRLFGEYNQVLARMGWGFQFDLQEVVDLRGVDRWFTVNARNGDNRRDLEIAAKQDPSLYRYRADALNIYVNNSSSGVSGGHLPLIGDVIFVGANGYTTLMFHEIGHAFGLCHTFGCDCNGSGESAECDAGSLSDNIDDTIRDSPGWSSRETVAANNFFRIYSLLSTAQQLQVDEVWSNIMSYHEATNNPLNRLTHDQWERIVDISNLEKLNVASGRTVFVDRAGQGLSPCELASSLPLLVENLPGPTSWYLDAFAAAPPPLEAYFRRNCQTFAIDPPMPSRPPGYPSDWPWPPTASFPNPPPGYPSDWPWPPVNPQPYSVCVGGYKTVTDAIDCGARNGDRVQIKAGHYNEILRITKRVTLATDRGTVVIGRP